MSHIGTIGSTTQNCECHIATPLSDLIHLDPLKSCLNSKACLNSGDALKYGNLRGTL